MVWGSDVLAKAQELMRIGDYWQCAAVVNDSQEQWNKDLQLLRVRALMMTGPYEEAATAAMQLIRRSNGSMEALMLVHDSSVQVGQTDFARTIIEQIKTISQQVPIEAWYAADLVALGRSELLLGGDPKNVLEQYFNRAAKLKPEYLPAYLAAGELALGKNDYELAEKQFSTAAKFDGENPDVLWGLARCEKSNDRVKMMSHIDSALAINPNHIGCLLLKTEHEIDREAYDQARDSLKRIEAINPALPEMWCYRAVLAHLAGDEQAQAAARAKALEPWPTNPLVDHLIGRKLSDKYRFKEGAEHQRRAINLIPKDDSVKKIPATIQLAQDLLRLGQEKEGWALAEHVADSDGYQVVAHNLATLRQHLGKYETIENEHFIVRMDPREAKIYGSDVMALLAESSQVLGGKYGLRLDGKITVEIFADEQDFAIRTFGVPGSAGYLGVCFGKVITMNSPAGLSGGHASWRSVLWHEFCHTVTLHMSMNKMPRWLSEGISVHEELQRDPTWGQRMTPEYRTMILAGKLSPITQMSSAFMNPPSGQYLLFAYYQSALAVEFLITRYGQDHLRKILVDLGLGMSINTAIETNTEPLPEVEFQFKNFVRARMLAGLASEAVMAVPDAKTLGDTTTAHQWANQHLDSYWSQRYLGDQFAKARNWAEARTCYEKAIAMDPNYAGPDSAYEPLATACKQLGDEAGQRATWTKLAALSPTAVNAYNGLISLATKEKNWAEVARLAELLLSINPMSESPRRAQARAAEETSRTSDAIDSYNKLLLLNPVDTTEVHYRLGYLLADSDTTLAKRHVLDALAQAPRFRAAHALLLKLESKKTLP
jgi:tetratricopeptide (TPR) repeat protein